eukprot:291965-Pleurochrysis_carterae.AAC.4
MQRPRHHPAAQRGARWLRRERATAAPSARGAPPPSRHRKRPRAKRAGARTSGPSPLTWKRRPAVAAARRGRDSRTWACPERCSRPGRCAVDWPACTRVARPPS